MTEDSLLRPDAAQAVTAAQEPQEREFDPAVERAQQQLIALGYELGPEGADGLFGEQTAAALRSFQADHGLPETGELDDATRSALDQAVPEVADAAGDPVAQDSAGDPGGLLTPPPPERAPPL